MRKKLLKLFLLSAVCLFLIFSPNFKVYAESSYYLGGIPAGFSLNTRGAMVVGLSEILSNGTSVSPSKDAGVKTGDIVLEIDGNEVNTSDDIESALGGKSIVNVKILRNDVILNFVITPQRDVFGKNKLGLYIRNNVSGIGTVTYVKNGVFASLGHPVLSENGDLLEILDGKLYNCTITGAIKGERGKAGELRGLFLKDEPFAFAEKNTETGVYGKISDENLKKLNLSKVDIAEAKVGDAKIYTTVEGSSPKEYDISIIKTDKFENSNKNLVLKVTDKTLISITGGIVQGMSGSPILQNGKLVGAVTHVFVYDPQRGFGIMIENMS